VRLRRSTLTDQVAAPLPPEPEQAWKALSLVDEWVKHAEAKLGVVLAATAASGGILFNLVRDRSHASVAFDVAAVVCGASVLAAGACAMIGLYPRVRLRRGKAADTVNPLFFHDVARAYNGDAPSYSAVLHTLTTNADDLVRHLGQQIHANATVAHRKYVWANRAIRALLLDLLSIAALTTIIALKK
jgi:hypothetical protein